MIKKIIIFSENNGDVVNFMKSASSLRLSYMLRNVGYEVMQVHNCLSFTYDELELILESFSKGEPVLVCISTSFISTIHRKNIIFDESKFAEGEAWGMPTFNFFLRLMKAAKRKNFPIVMGGWEVNAWKFRKKDRHQYGIDVLDQYVSYYITNNNIEHIVKVCRGEHIDHIDVEGSRFVRGSEVLDYSDCSSAPIASDFIMPGEALSTEIAAGCIFSCQFCNYAALGKKKHEYMRTYESLEQELISNYENFKTRVYLLSDNIMNDYEEKLKFLIRIREKTGIDIRWTGYVRLDTIKRKEQAQLLLDSGIAGATFGIESLKKEAGPSIGKMTDKDKLLKSFEIFRSVIGDNAITTGSFIAGLPTETPDDLNKTYEWLNSEEGKYFLDGYTFTSLLLYQDNENKNEINKSRNNPFKDYVSHGSAWNSSLWTSPWGHSSKYIALARKYQIDSLKTRSRIRAFSIPFLHNIGLSVEKSVNIVRTMTVDQSNMILEKITPNNQIMINKYKKMLLNGVVNND